MDSIASAAIAIFFAAVAAIAGGRGGSTISVSTPGVTRRIPLRCFSARGHRSEIMFSVLVIILRPDHVAGLGLSLG
jgi:hypothetical protein